MQEREGVAKSLPPGPLLKTSEGPDRLEWENLKHKCSQNDFHISAAAAAIVAAFAVAN